MGAGRTKEERKENEQTAKCIMDGEIRKQDYKMQTLVVSVQNIKAWMVKPLSTCCVNTVATCQNRLHLIMHFK